MLGKIIASLVPIATRLLADAVIQVVWPHILNKLRELARKSDTPIDDRMVDFLAGETNHIVQDIANAIKSAK